MYPLVIGLSTEKEIKKAQKGGSMEEIFEVLEVINKDPKDLSGRNLASMGNMTAISDKRIKKGLTLNMNYFIEGKLDVTVHNRIVKVLPGSPRKLVLLETGRTRHKRG